MPSDRHYLFSLVGSDTDPLPGDRPIQNHRISRAGVSFTRRIHPHHANNRRCGMCIRPSAPSS